MQPKTQRTQATYSPTFFWLGLGSFILGAVLFSAILIASHGVALPVLAFIGQKYLSFLGITASLVLSYSLLGVGLSNLMMETNLKPVKYFFKHAVDVLTCKYFHQRLFPKRRINTDTVVFLSNSATDITTRLGGAGSKTEAASTVPSELTSSRSFVEITPEEYNRAFGEDRLEASINTLGT